MSVQSINGKIKNIEVSAALDSIEPEVTLAEDVSDSVDTSSDFTHMKSKELYEMCLERGIEVEAKQPKEYYIEKLS